MSGFHNTNLPQHLDAASIARHSSTNGLLSGMKFVTKSVDETKRQASVPHIAESRTVVRKVSRLAYNGKRDDEVENASIALSNELKSQGVPIRKIASSPAVPEYAKSLSNLNQRRENSESNLAFKQNRKKENGVTTKTRKVAKIGPNFEDYVISANSWRKGQEKALKLLGPMKSGMPVKKEEKKCLQNGSSNETSTTSHFFKTPIEETQEIYQSQENSNQEKKLELMEVEQSVDNDNKEQLPARNNKKTGGKRKSNKPQEPEKQSLPKIRHYNADVVRTYIDKQRKERKLQRQTELEQKQKETEEKHQKLKQLQELQKKLLTANVSKRGSNLDNQNVSTQLFTEVDLLRHDFTEKKIPKHHSKQFSTHKHNERNKVPDALSLLQSLEHKQRLGVWDSHPNSESEDETENNVQPDDEPIQLKSETQLNPSLESIEALSPRTKESANDISLDPMTAKSTVKSEKVAALENLASSCKKMMDEILNTFQADSQKKLAEAKSLISRNLMKSNDIRSGNRLQQLGNAATVLQQKLSEEREQLSRNFLNQNQFSNEARAVLSSTQDNMLTNGTNIPHKMNGNRKITSPPEVDQFQTYHERIVKSKNKSTVFEGNLPGIDNLIQHAQKVSEKQEKILAVTTIQAFFRGWRVRKLLKWRLPSAKTFENQNLHAFKLPVNESNQNISFGSLSEGSLDNADSSSSSSLQHSLKVTDQWSLHSELKTVPDMIPKWKTSDSNFHAKKSFPAVPVSASQYNFINTIQRTHGQGKRWVVLSPNTSTLTPQQRNVQKNKNDDSMGTEFGYSENKNDPLRRSSAGSNHNVEVKISTSDHTNVTDIKDKSVPNFVSSEATVTYSTTFSSGMHSQIKKTEHHNEDFMTSTPVVVQEVRKSLHSENNERPPDTAEDGSLSEGTLTDNSTLDSDNQSLSTSKTTTIFRENEIKEPGISGASYIRPKKLAEFLTDNAPDKVLKFSPNTLKLRMSTELTYLESVENSLQQLKEVERVQAIALAQQETVSLAQLLQGEHRRQHDGRNQQLLRQQQDGNNEKLSRRRSDDSLSVAVDSGQNFQANTSMTINVNTQKLFESQAEAAKITAEATKQLAQVQLMAIDYANSQLHGANEMASAAATSAAIAAVTSTLKQLRERHIISSDPHSSRSVGRSRSTTHSTSKSQAMASRKTHTDRTHDDSNTLSEIVEESVEVLSDLENVNSPSLSSHSIDIGDLSALPASVPDEQPSLSEGSISEEILEEAYSSKFDESVSEEMEKLAAGSDHKKQIKNNYAQDSMVSKFRINNDNLSQASSGDQNSLPGLTMQYFQQYMKDEELRSKHQETMLKLREQSLIEKTKAEMTWLELQRQECREKGEEDKASTMKKRQRALLMKLQQEQVEIKRLRDAQKLAVEERQLLWNQQHQILKMRKSTRDLMDRIQETVPGQVMASLKTLTKNLNTRSLESSPRLSVRQISDASSNGTVLSEEEFALLHGTKERNWEAETESRKVERNFKAYNAEKNNELTSTSPASPLSESPRNKKHFAQRPKSSSNSNFQGSNGLKKLQNSKRNLTAREQKLQQRRKNVEELLYWRQKLDNEERYIQVLEDKAKQLEFEHLKKTRRIESDTANSEDADKNDSISKPVAHSSESKTKSTDRQSESIPTSVHSNKNSISEKIEINSTMTGSGDVVSSEISYSNTNERATATNKSELSEELKTKAASDYESPFESSTPPKKISTTISHVLPDMHSVASTSRRPLSPRTQFGKRRDSSGSEESFHVSHSETASDVSDFEGRIQALKEELRRRKAEAERLRREQKRRNREHMKAQEASLLKKIKAYDKYINNAMANLEKETDGEANIPVKPQIRQPKIVDAKYLPKPLAKVGKLNVAADLVTEEVLHSLHSDSQSDKTESNSTVKTKQPSVISNEDVTIEVDESFSNKHSAALSEKLAIEKIKQNDNSRSDSIKSVSEQVATVLESRHSVSGEQESSHQKLISGGKGDQADNVESNDQEKVDYEELASSWEVESVLSIEEEGSTDVSQHVSIHSMQEKLSNNAKSSTDETLFLNKTFRVDSLEGMDDDEDGDSVEITRDTQKPTSKPDHVFQDDEKVEKMNESFFSEHNNVENGQLIAVGLQNFTSAKNFPNDVEQGILKPVAETKLLAENISNTLFTSLLNESIAIMSSLGTNELKKVVHHVRFSKDESDIPNHSVENFTTIPVSKTEQASHPAKREDIFVNILVKDMLEEAVSVMIFIYSKRRRTESDIVACDQQQSVSERVASILQEMTKGSKDYKERISASEALCLSSPNAYSDVLSYFPDESDSTWQGTVISSDTTKPAMPSQVNMVIQSKEANRVESEIADQEWFDDNLGLGDDSNNFYQIYPYPYYIREIPNKPPPPYTPPKQIQDTHSSSSGAILGTSPVPFENEHPAVIQVLLPDDELKNLIRDSMQNIHKLLQDGVSIERVAMPDCSVRIPKISSSSRVDRNYEGNCVAYRRFVFDFTKEIAVDFVATQEEPCPVWMKPKRLAPKCIVGSPTWNSERWLDWWMNSSQRQVWNIFEEKLPTAQPEQISMVLMKFGRRRRDRVDEILIRELREEEQEWVTYDHEELLVKNQLADSIFASLVGECCTLLNSMQARKTGRQSRQPER